MDLNSMLNGPNAPKLQPPTPNHSISQATFQHPHQTLLRTESQHASYFRERPPQPPTLEPPDPRSPGGGPHYSVQSPYPHNSASTSTLSAGGQSIHGQSLGTQSRQYVTRNGGPPSQSYNHAFAPSPSPMALQPSTPSQALQQYQYQQTPSSRSSVPPSSLYNQVFSARETSIPPTAAPHSQSRQYSPHPQFHPQPAAPLGPPGPYSRPSPQTQRPPSQGYDHYRSLSSSSLGSLVGHEYGERNMKSPMPQPPREVTQRQYSVDRERSQSVSPKTIPQSSPYRQMSIDSQNYSHATPPAPRQTDHVPIEQPLRTASIEPTMDSLQGTSTPLSASVSSNDPHPGSSQPSSSQPSPAPTSTNYHTPKSVHAALPSKSSPQVQNQASLKRTASVVSASSASSQPVRKRLRRDEIPIFARSARARPPNLTGRFPNNPPPKSQSVPSAPVMNGHASVNGNGHHTPAPTSVPVASDELSHRSITSVTPYEDLTRWVCDHIFLTIGNGEQPTDGAAFEIEAKIGEIHDNQEGQRLSLPVLTETIFDKNRHRSQTRFESSMNMAQHKSLNEFLNSLVQQSLKAPDREPIFYDHPKEADDFFELTPAGQANLPPQILEYLNPRHKPKVRRTTNLETNEVKAQIIKSRIADFDVFNPSALDYRISISIESPWNGSNEWLIPMNQRAGERNKDRMSYRHQAYQIDLTQVSYPGVGRKEHELEVEISTEQIRLEIARLRRGEASGYEDLVRGFIDNVRILARRAKV